MVALSRDVESALYLLREPPEQERFRRGNLLLRG